MTTYDQYLEAVERFYDGPVPNDTRPPRSPAATIAAALALALVVAVIRRRVR